jgi:hypothetical protein
VDGEIVVERELARPFSVEQVGKPERWFALDSTLEGAVSSEPVSGPEFPVYQGNYREFCRSEPQHLKSTSKTTLLISNLG